ncbi:MAG: radical SAM protein [Bacteroidales bacterium]|nr:radical SAM protein [Bacteroidales bacterium]
METDRFLVYAPLRRAAFVGNAQVVNFLADVRAGIYDPVADGDGAMRKFLQQLEILDSDTEEPPVSTFAEIPEATAVSLFLTTACNLRCTYCYASAGDTAPKFMSLQVAKQGIDFVIGNAVKKNLGHIEVNYHGGGEPAINWHTLTESLGYARLKASEHGMETIASLATNGVLNDRQIDWIIENIQGASVSFDGLPEMHDRHRVTPSGKGSSERVIHTLRRFDEAGFDYGIRVTVTADLIPMMADSVEYICSCFNSRHIQVEPVYQIGRWTDAPSAETGAFVAAYRDALARAKKYGCEIVFSGARLGILTNHFCSATRDMFALTPDGTVSACYEVFSEDNPWAKVFLYGKPAETGGYTFDRERLAFLRKQAVQHRDYCRDCFARWTCGGDCYHKALTMTGSLEFSGTSRCNIIHELTRDQILSRIAESGGIFWHEPPEEAII